MTPIAQLDPASLTLWYDPENIHPPEERGNARLGEAIQHVLYGNHEMGVLEALSIENAEDKLSCCNLIGSIWHEQRHFLDLLLTNFGAFRLRQFILLYANIGLVADIARKKGELVCPIEVYLDPVRREAMGIDNPDPDIVKIAQNMRDRKQMLVDDQETVPTSLGRLSFGGDAQLEAMAYFSQIFSVQHYFGPEISFEIQRFQTEAKGNNLRYRWADIVFRNIGFIPSMEIAEGITSIDLSLVCPILIASLCCRYWKQEQIRNDLGGSGYPKERLTALIHEFGEKPGQLRGMKVLDVWERVNAIAKKLWGRTIVEELQIDFEKEGKFYQELWNNSDTPAFVGEWVREIHQLRGKLLDLLISNPELVVDPDQFSQHLLFRLRPQPILTKNSGVIGDVTEGWEVVAGRSRTDREKNEVKWWWAVTPKKLPRVDEETLGLINAEATCHVASLLAPTAKMMLNGRRHRTMLAPEILLVEQAWNSQGLRIRYEAPYALPEMQDEVGDYLELRKRFRNNCDFCRKPVAASAGASLVPAWTFRSNSNNEQFMIHAYGGDPRGIQMFLQDWTPWLACPSCCKLFDIHNGTLNYELKFVDDPNGS